MRSDDQHLTLTASPTELHNTQGDVNYLQGYFDLHIWYTNTDNITPTVFGRQVASALVQSITSYNKSVTSSYLIEVVDSGKEINENLGSLVKFHRIITIKAINYDNG